MEKNKVLINKKGLVDPPVYPCNKGEGKCQLRTLDTDDFACVYEPEFCRYRKKETGGDRTTHA